jgi:hypothetical protein
MLTPAVRRFWEGIEIEGEQICLQLFPTQDAKIRVRIIALPILSGFDRRCDVTSSEETKTIEFLLNEIVVTDTALSCMAADETIPFMRRGFDIVLEPGMAQLLRTWLPKLFLVATAAKTISGLADTALRAQEPPVYAYHLFSMYTNALANIILDKRSVEDAIARERLEPRWGGGDKVRAMFEIDAVHTKLLTIGKAASHVE